MLLLHKWVSGNVCRVSLQGRREKDQAPLSRRDTQICFQQTDIGSASTRAQKKPMLRHHEQSEMDSIRQLSYRLKNYRRVEAPSKKSRNESEIKSAGAGKIGKKE